MNILNGYAEIIVIQRRKETGCIPTGIEWMLRYLKISNVNLDNFQERHDLGVSNNSFWAVSQHVMAEMPHIRLVDKNFLSAEDKIAYIKSLINKSMPCLVSLASIKGCHIVPAVEISNKDITVLWMDKATVAGQKKIFTFEDISRMHNFNGCGTDILFAENRVAT